jgi:glutathione S-transferase
VYQLVIGNKNYSSWSLRPYLVLTHHGIPFEEIVIPLYRPESKRELLKYNPAGKVPCLLDGGRSIWDSLAIMEYLAERFPQKKLWPEDLNLRSVARSISAEMHSGFLALRQEMPMNCRGAASPDRQFPEEVGRDVLRIREIWKTCLENYGGPFLFGSEFGIADAMYAPVVLRFQTYRVALSEKPKEYADAILALPALQQWLHDAREESWVLDFAEAKLA